jgi:hypothetical protein
MAEREEIARRGKGYFRKRKRRGIEGWLFQRQSDGVSLLNKN